MSCESYIIICPAHPSYSYVQLIKHNHISSSSYFYCNVLHAANWIFSICHTPHTRISAVKLFLLDLNDPPKELIGALDCKKKSTLFYHPKDYISFYVTTLPIKIMSSSSFTIIFPAHHTQSDVHSSHIIICPVHDSQSCVQLTRHNHLSISSYTLICPVHHIQSYI